MHLHVVGHEVVGDAGARRRTQRIAEQEDECATGHSCGGTDGACKGSAAAGLLDGALVGHGLGGHRSSCVGPGSPGGGRARAGPRDDPAARNGEGPPPSGQTNSSSWQRPSRLTRAYHPGMRGEIRSVDVGAFAAALVASQVEISMAADQVTGSLGAVRLFAAVVCAALGAGPGVAARSRARRHGRDDRPCTCCHGADRHPVPGPALPVGEPRVASDQARRTPGRRGGGRWPGDRRDWRW